MLLSVLYYHNVFALFSVVVAVSTHVCVFCRHFCCPICFKAMLLVGILPQHGLVYVS